MRVGVGHVFVGNRVWVSFMASFTFLLQLRLLNVSIVAQLLNVSWFWSTEILLDVSYGFEMHSFLWVHTFRQVFGRFGLRLALHHILADLLRLFQLLINLWNNFRQTRYLLLSVIFWSRLLWMDWNFSTVVSILSTVLYLFLSILFFRFVALWWGMRWLLSLRLNSPVCRDMTNRYLFLGLALLRLGLTNWTFGKDFLTLEHILRCCGLILLCFYFFSLHRWVLFEILLSSVTQTQTDNEDNDCNSQNSSTDNDVKHVIVRRGCSCSGRSETVCGKRVSKDRISTNLWSLLQIVGDAVVSSWSISKGGVDACRAWYYNWSIGDWAEYNKIVVLSICTAKAVRDIGI